MEIVSKFLKQPLMAESGTLLSRSTDYTTYQPNIHGAIYGFGAVSLAITTLTTWMRIFTKFHIIKVRRWDDHLMMASWCGLVVMWSLIFVSVDYGAGDHEDDITRSEVPGFLKYAFLHDLFYAIVQCLLKTSIALQILHIFVPNLTIRRNKSKKFWTIVIFTALQDIWFFIFFWVSLFQCDPVEKEFDPTIPGHCIKGWNGYNVAVSTWNMTSDICMLIFPMFCIWRLKMRLAFKFEAGGVFFVGALAVAASLLRLIFSIRALYTSDKTLVLTQVALCDAGEITAGIVVGNFVPFPKFVVYTYDKIRGLVTGEPVQRKESLPTADMIPFPTHNNSDGTRAGAAPTLPNPVGDDGARNGSAVSDMFSFAELMNNSRVQR